jgi:hypothetical protein
MLKNFYGSMIFTVICLTLAGIVGFTESGGAFSVAMSMVFIAAVLGVMETSLSLDNAVVNASVLKDMDEKWQRRFLSWGIIIAVFGMRIVFPLAIVAIAAWVSPWEALSIAIGDKARYEEIVTGAHIGISGFGGAFLMLVGLSFSSMMIVNISGWALSKSRWPLLLPFAPYIATAIIVAALSMLVEAVNARLS